MATPTFIAPNAFTVGQQPTQADMASITDAIVALQSHLTSAHADSGWVNITVNAGFAANGTPRVRLINGVVHFQDGFSNTGMTAGAISPAVGTIPVGLRPAFAKYVTVASSSGSAAAVAVVNTDGTIDIRVSSTLGSYYRLESITYPLG